MTYTICQNLKEIPFFKYFTKLCFNIFSKIYPTQISYFPIKVWNQIYNNIKEKQSHYKYSNTQIYNIIWLKRVFVFLQIYNMSKCKNVIMKMVDLQVHRLFNDHFRLNCIFRFGQDLSFLSVCQ